MKRYKNKESRNFIKNKIFLISSKSYISKVYYNGMGESGWNYLK